MRDELTSFVRETKKPLADCAWGLKVMKVAEAIFESAAKGEVVHLGWGP